VVTYTLQLVVLCALTNWPTFDKLSLLSLVYKGINIVIKAVINIVMCRLYGDL